MYVQRNIERGHETTVAVEKQWVLHVALLIQHETRMRHIVT